MKTPLGHLKALLSRRDGEADGLIALLEDETERTPRIAVTLGDLRAVATLASAHDGERAAKNLDDFGALTSKAARLERENAALLEDARFHKGQMAEAVAKSEALLLQLQRANDELIKERARGDAFFSALEMLAGVRP